MPARRCSICAINWPLAAEFSKCPACGEPADPIANDEHEFEDLADARSAAKRFKFERFYAEREASAPPLEQRGQDA